MIKIKVATDFALEPGARTYDDGPNSGEEFFDKLLKPKFKEALEKKTILYVDLDGVEGYASSFLNEAFRRLGEEFGSDLVIKNIELISTEIPKYKEKVLNALHESKKS